MAIREGVSGAPRRTLPQLDRLLGDPAVTALFALYGREQVKVQARRALAALRERLAAETPATPATALAEEIALLPRRIAAPLQAALGGALRRGLNATGRFVHTNL